MKRADTDPTRQTRATVVDWLRHCERTRTWPDTQQLALHCRVSRRRIQQIISEEWDWKPIPKAARARWSKEKP